MITIGDMDTLCPNCKLSNFSFREKRQAMKGISITCKLCLMKFKAKRTRLIEFLSCLGLIAVGAFLMVFVHAALGFLLAIMIAVIAIFMYPCIAPLEEHQIKPKFDCADKLIGDPEQ